MTTISNTARWTERATQQFVGKTITAAFYMDRDDAEAMGWMKRGLVLVLDDVAQVIVQQDDEGNGPGSLLYATTTDDQVFPALSSRD